MAFTGNYVCDSYRSSLFTGGVDFATDVIKIALYTNSVALNAATTEYTTDGEVVASGYVAGGEVLVPTLGGSGGVSFVNFDTVVWTMAATARGAMIYKDGGTAICVLDFGADKTSTTVFSVGYPVAAVDSALIRISSKGDIVV